MSTHKDRNKGHKIAYNIEKSLPPGQNLSFWDKIQQKPLETVIKPTWARFLSRDYFFVAHAHASCKLNNAINGFLFAVVKRKCSLLCRQKIFSSGKMNLYTSYVFDKKDIISRRERRFCCLARRRAGKNQSDWAGQVNFALGQVKLEVWWPGGDVKLE